MISKPVFETCACARKSTAPLNNLAPCRLVGTGAPRSRTTFNFHEESITHPPSLSCVLMRLRKFQADRILHLCWQEKGLYLSSHASETHQNMTFDYYSELSLEMLQNPHLSAGVHLGVARLEPLIHMGFLTSPFLLSCARSEMLLLLQSVPKQVSAIAENTNSGAHETVTKVVHIRGE